MKLSELSKIHEMLDRHKMLKALSEKLASGKPVAIEVLFSEGVEVFSNSQPGAKYPLSEQANIEVMAALASSIGFDIDALESEFKALNVELD